MSPSGALGALRRRSLRTRLTGVLLSLAAIGLIALASVTYESQKRFLEQRVDEQAQQVVPFIRQQIVYLAYLKLYGITTTGSSTTGSGSTTAPKTHGADAGTAGVVTGTTPDADGNPNAPGAADPVPGVGDGAPQPGNGGGAMRRFPQGARDLPAGSYGQVRSSTGTVVGAKFLTDPSDTTSTETAQIPKPDIPKTLPKNAVFTVKAVSGDGSYRVNVSSDPSGMQTIVAIPVGNVTDQLHRLVLVEAVVILGILLILGLIASRLVSVELSPLRHIATDADAIAAGDLTRRVPEAAPGTEVGRLGVALNAMLGRIEEAFTERKASEDKLRRFLSDASHELRTPLASIRGYAELQRTGMIATEEERLVAVSRIEEQAARMGTLVEDLLALARLDEERAPATDLVELNGLARDAVADARSLDATREVSLETDGDPLVLGQESKLRQVFTNLLGNAIAHTPEGTPITVAVHTESGFAVVDVDDAGDGVPVEARQKIFERFHREAGGTARTRGPAGAGLGLAVGRGIIEAHGGSVAVTDAPTGGARFRVRLPLVDTTDEAGEGE